MLYNRYTLYGYGHIENPPSDSEDPTRQTNKEGVTWYAERHTTGRFSLHAHKAEDDPPPLSSHKPSQQTLSTHSLSTPQVEDVKGFHVYRSKEVDQAHKGL